MGKMCGVGQSDEGELDETEEGCEEHFNTGTVGYKVERLQ